MTKKYENKELFDKFFLLDYNAFRIIFSFISINEDVIIFKG